MIISASVRPRNIKRGVSDKKLAAALGVRPCLSEMVGKLELSADCPRDFVLLREIYNVMKGSEYGGGGKLEITNTQGGRTLLYEDILSRNDSEKNME